MAIQTGVKSAEAIDQGIVKEQLSYINAMNDAPAIRLDAEFYQADDIDGAADGLMGSGNLNYLVLQSQQTTDANNLNNPFSVKQDSDAFGNDTIGGRASAGDASVRGPGSFWDDDSGMALSDNAGDGFSIGGMGNVTSDIPGIGAGSASGVSALKGFNYNGGGDYSDETNNIDITNIEYPPEPPEPPPETPEPPVNDDVDLTVDINTPVLDVDLDVILDPVEDILGDIDIDVDAIIDNILPGDHGLLPDITATVDAVLGGMTLPGVDLSDILDPLDPLLSNTAHILDGLIDGVEDLLPNELIQPITSIINTVVDLTGLNGDNGDTDLLINLGAVIPGFTMLDTALNIPLNPVEVLLGDIDITADAQALVDDLGTHAFSVIDDLHDGNIAGVVDTVIGDGGIFQDVTGVIPDLIFGLDVATDILPDFAGSLSTDDLLGSVFEGVLGGNDPAPGGDTDLTLDTGIELLGIEMPDLYIDVPLDIAESLVGDIDIDIDLASFTQPESVTDILEDLSAGDIDGVIDDLGTSIGLDVDLDLLGGAVIDTTIPDLGDAVGSLLGHSPVPDVLPDPVGTITEGIGNVIDTTPVLGGLGGLLHGGGGGGLFG